MVPVTPEGPNRTLSERTPVVQSVSLRWSSGTFSWTRSVPHVRVTRTLRDGEGEGVLRVGHPSKVCVPRGKTRVGSLGRWSF